jgi:hypothetical protein
MKRVFAFRCERASLSGSHVGLWWWPKRTRVESGPQHARSPFAASIVRAAALTNLQPLDFCTLYCAISARQHHQAKLATRFCVLTKKMLAIGRGSIAQVQYTGDEAAGEIKKLLDAVVSFAQPRRFAHADIFADRRRG